MVTPYDVYLAYKKASGKCKKIPSEDKYRNRINENSLLEIDRLCLYFNTIYVNIDIYEYMKCGFSLWKNFSFSKFTDPRVFDLYKKRDKAIKRNTNISLQDIERSFSNIKIPLYKYCNLIEDYQKKIIYDYLLNKISSIIVVYCMENGLVDFNDLEELLLYNIINNYDKWKSVLRKWNSCIEEFDNQLKEYYDEEE